MHGLEANATHPDLLVEGTRAGSKDLGRAALGAMAGGWATAAAVLFGVEWGETCPAPPIECTELELITMAVAVAIAAVVGGSAGLSIALTGRRDALRTAGTFAALQVGVLAAAVVVLAPPLALLTPATIPLFGAVARFVVASRAT